MESLRDNPSPSVRMGYVPFMSAMVAGLLAMGLQVVSTAEGADGPALPPGALMRLGAQKFVHGDEVRDVAYSADGKTLLAMSRSDVVLWEVNSGKMLRQYQTSTAALARDGQTFVMGNNSAQVMAAISGEVRSALPGIAASRLGRRKITDGQRVACHEGREVFVWDIAQGKELRRWSAGQDQVPNAQWIVPLEFSTDGKALAIRCIDDATPDLNQIWLFPLEGTSGAVRLDAGDRLTDWLRFSPDGKRAVGTCEIKFNGGHRSYFRIWDTATGRTVHEVPGSFNGCAFSPDGAALAVSAHWDIRIYDVVSGQERARFAQTPERIAGMAFSPDGKALAASQGKRIRFWDAATWKELLPAAGHQEPITAIAISPDNRTIATGDQKGRILLWSWPEGREKNRIDNVMEIGEVGHLSFSPDGSKLGVTSPRNGKSSGFLFDTATGKELVRFGRDRYPFNGPVRFLPGGREFMTTEWRWISVWETDSGKLLRSIDLTNNAVRAVYPVDGGDRAWWAGERQALGLKNLKTGEDLVSLKGGSHHFSARLDVSSDGAWLMVNSRVWDLVSGTVATNWHGDSRACAFSRDSRLVAVAHGQEVVLWDTGIRKEIHRFAAGIDYLRGALAISPDCRFLVTTDNAGAVVWDLTGQLQNGHLPVLTPTAEEMETWWRIMGSNDHWEAQKAAWSFAAAGEAAVKFISSQLSPVTDYDRAQFQLLPFAAKVRPLRAVMALEHNPAPGAQALLESWAKGQTEAPFTRAAIFARDRRRNAR